jgi:hypothetical protein
MAWRIVRTSSDQSRTLLSVAYDTREEAQGLFNMIAHLLNNGEPGAVIEIIEETE